MTKRSSIAELAPAPEPLDPEWSQATLVAILAADRPEAATARRRRRRRRTTVALAAAFLTLGTATAVAVVGPSAVVKRVLIDFSEQPNTTGNHLGVLHDPQLVAQFPTPTGTFTLWFATSSSGKLCWAMANPEWDGRGSPDEDELSYGCGGDLSAGGDSPPEELTRPDQLGGFFKDDAGPIVYGVSAFADAVRVHVQGLGVDRTLPIDPDSHGYGAALPEAVRAKEVTLTYLDAEGRTLGSKRSVAPVG